MPVQRLFPLFVVILFSSTLYSQTTTNVTPTLYPLPDDMHKTGPALRSLTDSIASFTVVGLGEGTHGTRQFTQVRSELTRQLVEDKGYGLVVFENPYGHMFALNEALPSTADADLNTLMKKHLLAIYQTEEVKSFLQWARGYMNAHPGKLRLAGMDTELMHETALLLKKELAGPDHQTIHQAVDSLVWLTARQDSLWEAFNHVPYKKLIPLVESTMPVVPEKAAAIGKLAAEQQLVLSAIAKECLQNFRMYPSRDEQMARMVATLADQQPGKRTVVWAHNVHVANNGPFGQGDNIVGGMGRFFRKAGLTYFAIGTGTAGGTYSMTNDRFIHNGSKFSAVLLRYPHGNSWEMRWFHPPYPAFYHYPQPNEGPGLLHRLIGYGKEPTETDQVYTKVPLDQLYNAFIFITSTTAAIHL